MFGLFLMWDVGFVSCGTWGLFHAGRGVCFMRDVGFVSYGLSHMGCGVCLMQDVGFVSCGMWGLWNDCSSIPLY